MAGHPQENSWTQQGSGYPQGAPGYGPAYDQQGQQAPYPQPGGYEQTQVFEQQSYQPYAQQPQQSYPGQPQPGQPQPGQPKQGGKQWQPPKPRPASAPGGAGFVASLFDFGFTSFVTPKIIKALYALVTAWTLLWAVLLFFIGLHNFHMAGALFVLIIVDPILILVSLGVLRVVLEFFMVTFRMQEDLRALRERSAGPSGRGSAAGPDVPPPGSL